MRSWILWVITAFVACDATSHAAQPMLRISIKETGIYSINGAQLRSLGIPVESIDPQTLQLRCETWLPQPLDLGVVPASWETTHSWGEVAILVWGEEDGVLDDEDQVVFYAVGPDEYLDVAGVDSLNSAHYEYPFDDERILWLQWGLQQGQRMPALDATSDPGPGAISTGDLRIHVEENSLFGAVDDLWFWQFIRASQPAVADFALPIPSTDNVEGNIRVTIGMPHFAFVNLELPVELNGQSIGTINWIPSTEPPATASFVFPATMAPVNQLRVLNTGPGPSTTPPVLVELDVSWTSTLMAHDGALAWISEPDSMQTFELSGFASRAPLLLDVTDPDTPQHLTGLTLVDDPAAPRWRFANPMPRARTHYSAAIDPRPVDPGTLDLVEVDDLRQQQASPHMLIVAHPSLVAEAERLATHRRQNLPGVESPEVLVRSVEDIYVSFSGGRLDPMAIRNYVKFLWDRQPGRLQFLLLFGDASRDPRGWRDDSAANLVPAVHPWYSDANATHFDAVEDWFVEMDVPSGSPDLSYSAPVPDLAVGRIPAATVDEAKAVVDKIIAFDTSPPPGPWRTRVILTADDLCSAGRCTEAFHIRDSDPLADSLPQAFDLEKLYLTEFPLEGRQKPQARQALLELWERGAAVVHYSGRSGSSQLADEVLLLSPDVDAMNNSTRLPVFINMGKTAPFDTNFRSLGEALSLHPDGGALAVVSSTRHSFAGPNRLLSVSLFGELYRDAPSTMPTIGRALQRAKSSLFELNLRSVQSVVLLGDPASRLLAPASIVTFAGADTLIVGEEVVLEGIIHPAGAPTADLTFNGTAEILLRSSTDDSGYQSPESPFMEVEYDLPGVPLMKLEVPVVHGQFEARFTVPPHHPHPRVGPLDPVQENRATRQANVRHRAYQTVEFGPKARLRVYAHSGTSDAQGAVNSIVYLEHRSPGAVGPVQDTENPSPPETSISIPSVTAFHGASPNPGNPSTSFAFDIATTIHVSLQVFDVSGRLVRTLVDEALEPRTYHVNWNGRDLRGATLSSGVYFAVLQAGSIRATRKTILVR